MASEIRHIKKADRPQQPAERFMRAAYKSDMVMVRHYVSEAVENNDKELGEFIYSQLVEQCRALARNFGFKLE